MPRGSFHTDSHLYDWVLRDAKETDRHRQTDRQTGCSLGSTEEWAQMVKRLFTDESKWVSCLCSPHYQHLSSSPMECKCRSAGLILMRTVKKSPVCYPAHKFWNTSWVICLHMNKKQLRLQTEQCSAGTCTGLHPALRFHAQPPHDPTRPQWSAASGFWSRLAGPEVFGPLPEETTSHPEDRQTDRTSTELGQKCTWFTRGGATRLASRTTKNVNEQSLKKNGLTAWWLCCQSLQLLLITHLDWHHFFKELSVIIRTSIRKLVWIGRDSHAALRKTWVLVSVLLLLQFRGWWFTFMFYSWNLIDLNCFNT